MRLLVLAVAATQATSPPPPAPAVPFAVGERLEYSAKWGVLSVGRAALEVASIDTVRDVPAYRFRYSLDASAPLGVYSITSTLESWTATQTFHSLRYRQANKEKGRRYIRQFEIYPDSARYQQIEPELLEPKPTVEDPLDDASVLYFLRTMPLEVGQTYRLNRYFRAERNPIIIKVLKRVTLELPDGTKVPCLELNPVVGERGLFAPRTNARLWLTDDARRIPVQIRSEQPYGTITLRLEKMRVRS